MAEKRRCNRHIRVSETTLKKVKLTAKIMGLSTPNDAVSLLCDRIIREHEEVKKSKERPGNN
jgi:antitoxin component of RelBE/YafQ-DinJ toxin-antitoxin module